MKSYSIPNRRFSQAQAQRSYTSFRKNNEIGSLVHKKNPRIYSSIALENTSHKRPAFAGQANCYMNKMQRFTVTHDHDFFKK